MRIGLFGGSFNPVHEGHIYIANKALKKLRLDQIWLLPTLQNPLKEKSATPYKQRLEACIKAIKNHPRILVKDFEKNSIFTHDLIKKIRASHINCEFVWIMGADNLNKFHQWKNYQLLIKLMEFAVFSRQEFLFKARAGKAFKLYEKYKVYGKGNKKLPNISLIRVKNCDISSSEIRKN